MTSDGKMPEPFLLSPAGKDYLWGGNRLKKNFGKNLPMDTLAETWECSTHPDGPSIVASGDLCGKTLTEVIREHPEYLGAHAAKTARRIGADGLPILIKFIDAKYDLSIQVHPDDVYAFSHEGQPGKTEMWYVMDAEPGARLVYGFHQSTDKDTIREAIHNGSLMKYLNKVGIRKDDVFLIRSGTVHAIGAGSLLAEIQENSNLTYRLYDYERLDKDGKKRELHVEEALRVSDLGAADELRQPLRVLRYRRGMASELLCRCEYFEVQRMLLNNEGRPYELKTDELSFQVLLCMEGNGQLEFQKENLKFKAGRCVFIPAGTKNIQLTGKAQMLLIIC